MYGDLSNSMIFPATSTKLQSGYRHKDTQIRYKGLKRTRKSKKNKETQQKTNENLRYQGTLVSPGMFLSVCLDCTSFGARFSLNIWALLFNTGANEIGGNFLTGWLRLATGASAPVARLKKRFERFLKRKTIVRIRIL